MKQVYAKAVDQIVCCIALTCLSQHQLVLQPGCCLSHKPWVEVSCIHVFDKEGYTKVLYQTHKHAIMRRASFAQLPVDVAGLTCSGCHNCLSELRCLRLHPQQTGGSLVARKAAQAAPSHDCLWLGWRGILGSCHCGESLQDGVENSFRVDALVTAC